MNNINIAELPDMDICELITRYTSPFFHHLCNPEVISIIAHNWKLDGVVDFSDLVTKYIHRLVLITHVTYPPYLDQLILLLIKYRYQHAVDLILSSKIMLYSTGVDVLKYLLQYDLERFVEVCRIGYNGENEYVRIYRDITKRLVRYMFTHNMSDHTFHRIVDEMYDTRDYVDKYQHRYNRIIPNMTTIYPTPPVCDRCRLVRTNDVDIWKTYGITSEDLSKYFDGKLCKEICEYMNSVDYSVTKFIKCEDMYSHDWIVDRLQIKLSVDDDGEICGKYRKMVEPYGMSNFNVVYSDIELHPTTYLHLLSKCKNAECVIDLS